MQKKIIGTLIPMSALLSKKIAKRENGTFAEGLIFLDWLKKTHQSAWQLLPLYQTQLEVGSSTKRIPSPYKSYGIGLDPKYLPVNFKHIFPTEQEKNNFITGNIEWINNYALFCALADYFHTDDWRKWDQDICQRNKEALVLWTKKLIKEIDAHIIIQWQLHQAYIELKEKAKKLGIILIGDLSFYVSLQSPIVWAHQDVFQIEKNGTMEYVSGTLGGISTLFGRQIWGHPLYNWEDKDKKSVIAEFWNMRIHYMSKLFDYIRLDYAKGFFQYGAMDIANKDRDMYKNGPGVSFFENLVEFSEGLGLKIFAEDCGRNLDQLRESLQTLHIPGVKIFCFAFDEKGEIIDKEYADFNNYKEMNVVYTTIHDTQTLVGYLHNLDSKQKKQLVAITNIEYSSDDLIFAKILRDAILSSPARIVIIPIQDWLLTTERINIPGTELAVNDPNWNFHLKVPIENLPTNFNIKEVF